MNWSILAFALLGCNESLARVVVEDARATRRADGFVEVSIDVRGVEQNGGDVGPFCVSAHWLFIGADTSLLDPVGSYFGESDHAQLCTEGLADGDRRTLKVVSSTSTTVVAVPLRAQAGIGTAIEKKDITNP